MKKNFDLWVYSNPALRILITVLFIIVVGVSNVLASPNSSSVAVASKKVLQQAAVSGTVTDATTGEVLPGVNIRVQGTTVGAITDVDGKFTFTSVDRNAVLVFSFIGYVTQEIPIAGKAVVNVSLNSESKELSEVVVIGYGTSKKQTLTGSVAQINTAEILTTKTTSVASMIQGKVPGLLIRKLSGEPGVFTSQISIRGFGTPLLVIDGVVRDGMSDFERLNPNDIENISILKDASAAIYGMNADNGVMIVTTKSGTKGKTKIAYSGTFTWKQPTSTDQQKSVDAYTYRLMKNEMSRNAGQPEPYSAGDMALWKAGTAAGYTDFNWYKAAYSDWTNSNQQNFSITGGNDDITHYTSFGFMNDKGLFTHNENENYQKYNFRTSFDAKLAKGLRARVIFAGKYDNQMGPAGNSYFWIFKQVIVADRGIGPHTLANVNHPTTVPAENVNPTGQFTRSMTGYVQNQNYQYQVTTELTYDIPVIKGLQIGLLGAFDGNISQATTLRLYPLLYDYKTDAPPAGGAGTPTLNENLSLFSRGDVQTKIIYKNTFAQAHTFSILLVNEMRKLGSRNVGGQRQYDNVLTHDILDQASTTNQTTRGGKSREAYVSYMGRINYDFRNKYLVEFTFREDGSYRYAPGQRWAFFPAGSIGWRISEEAFMKNNVPTISNLKLRASYGAIGADGGSAWNYLSGYKLSNMQGGAVLSPDVLTLGMVPPGVINNNLTWINTTTADIGLDLELWRGKLGFVGDIFQKNRTGLTATRSSAVPNTFGASFPQENLNSDVTRGFEAEVSHRNKIGDISYGVSANVTYSRRFLQHQERSPYTNTYQIWKDGNAGNWRIQNRLQLYQYDGIFTNVTQYETAPLQGGTSGNSKPLPGETRILDINGDGRINGDDQLPIGWSNGDNPPLQFGMNMNASWKGFDINMLLQGAALFTYPINRGDTWGYRTYPSAWAFWLDRWHQADITVDPHDPAAVWIPGKYEALMNSPSGTTLDNGTFQWNPLCTYLRIKNLEIGYTIPMNVTRKIFVDNIRVSLNIVNLATFCKKDLKKFDPEKPAGDYNAGGVYPLLREFNFGININF